MLSTPKLEVVRDTFLSDGRLTPEAERVLRPVVLESWKRSRLFGNADRGNVLPFEAMIANEPALLNAARPILEKLVDELSMDHASLLVADRNSRILQTWAPNRAFSKVMARIGSEAGHTGAEEVVGTNGIGTTATDRRPNMIVGAEHIADALTDFACVGAPIYNPLTRKLQGVVTLTALAKDASPVLPGLLNQAAREIGRELYDLSSLRERALFDAFLAASRHGRAVVVIGGDLLLENPAASALLREHDGVSPIALVSESVSMKTPRQRVRIASERTITELWCSAVILNDEVIGAVVEVDNQITVEPALESVDEGPRNSAWPPLADALPGSSPAWVSTRETAEAVMRAGIPAVIFGANGSGKTTLARAMFSRLAPDGPPTILDGNEAAEAPEPWLEHLGTALAGDAPIILKHIDALPDDLARRVGEHFITNPALLDRGLVLGTGNAQGESSAPGRRVLLDALAVGRIEMPNLRERRDDLRVLLRALEHSYAPGRMITYTQGAFQALSRAPWPGNLRQLDSVMRGVFALGRRNEVTVDHLPPGIASYARRRDLTMLEQLEVDGIVNALIRCGGNKVLAADMLGISRSTLYRKMNAYRLDEERLFL